ncbi:MAG: TonB family protein [Edaphobacter sp.]
MPFFLDTQETVHRFGGAIAEFSSLLDANHVRHGSPNDFFDFAKTLEHSNQFRMDLSALVKSIVNKERDELLLTDMMSIIAASVGGRSLPDTTADITGPTNTLMEFLLGTGCWKHFGSPRPVVQRTTQPYPPVARAEESEPMRISLPASPAKTAAEATEDKASLLEISNELRQTLSRLESNTQQVKLHLDSIEQRIGTMEPSQNALPTNKSTGLEPLLHRGAVDAAARNVVPIAEEIAPIEPSLPTRARAVFAGPLHLKELEADEEDDTSSPTFAYGSEKRRVIVPVVLFVILAAIAAAVFFYFHSAGNQSFLKAGLARIEGKQANLNSNSAPAASESPTNPSAVASNPAGDSSIPSPPASQPNPAASESASVPMAASDATNATPSSDTSHASNDSKFRYVPASVMEGYLLSAPRPEYPVQARADHVEGQVAMQATISRSGAITSLHVIKGPPSLLSAAVAAVRTWRYRPYSVDGEPQDVATTVYVDFTLKPPPVLVH